MFSVLTSLFKKNRPLSGRPTVIAAQPPPVQAHAAPLRTPEQIGRELRQAVERVGQEYLEFGEVVPDDSVASCRVFANRYRGIESLPKGGMVGEVGTQTGRFADFIFRQAQPEKLHLFDMSLEKFDHSLLADPVRDGKVLIHVGDSSTELGKFSAEYFDWLYIDGCHSYAGVKKDISQAVRRVKRDGILVFNDYTPWSPLEACRYGVLKAVNELVNYGDWEFVYLALHPWGYHDVALRRRGSSAQ